jgi:hypothetical protein
MLPLSGLINPIMSRINVDLPQPLGPMSTVVFPGWIVKSTEWTAFVKPYALETFSSLIMGVGVFYLQYTNLLFMYSFGSYAKSIQLG